VRILLFLFRASRSNVIAAISFGIISGICSTALLALISEALTKGGLASATVIWGVVSLCFLMPVSKFISDFLLVRLGQGAVRDLRLKLSQQILVAPLRHIEEIGPHRLLVTLTDDISMITNAFLSVPMLCINVVIVIGCLIYLLWLAPLAFITVIFFLLLGISTYQAPILKGVRYQKIARERADNLFDNFHALTEGTKELKLHRRRRELFLSTVLGETLTALHRNNLKAMALFIAASSWGQTLLFVFIGIMLFVIPRVSNLNTGVLTTVIITVLYLITPIELIMNTASNLGSASVALKKIENMGISLESQPSKMATSIKPESSRVWKFLEMAGATHSYYHEKDGCVFTLGPIDFYLEPGEIVFLIGGNGSGKTTLIKLLTGLYKPESGEIRFKGELVTDERLEIYRQQFSAIFSDFYLFETLLGIDPTKLDERALFYLTQLQLEHKVQINNGHLSTVRLSQGQRKRLALLIALLEDRSIYVFDEWAADQDPLFKKIFYYQLLPELKSLGKTVVVISHDDRYYRVADRVIRLDNGKVVDPILGGDQYPSYPTSHP
jgi:putative ATP-binding cassette transporter